MFGSQWTKSTRQAEKTAAQAWDNLTSLVGSAGDTAKDATKRTVKFADRTGHKVGTVADEAWKRANKAVDALAGRKQSTPWLWLAGATVAGAVVGWAGAIAARRYLDRRDEEALTAADLADHEMLPVA